MRQILNIFRKDTRHLWPEILLVLATTVAFVGVYPYQWKTDFEAAGRGFHFDLQHLHILANVVTGCLPVTWFVLIARAVHSENLIGNRQFWLTRPYRWERLLGAKLLFIFAFVCLPFFIAEAALLMRAGFNPLLHVGGLLFNLLCMFALIMLPLFALTTVLSSLVRIVGLLIAIIAVILLMAFLASTFHGYDNPSVSIPFADRFSIPLLLCVCFAVLVVQYSKRRLWIARTLLIAGPLLIGIAAANPFDYRLVPHFYPDISSSGGAPFKLELRTPQERGTALGTYPVDEKHLSLSLPLSAVGINEGSAMRPDDIRVTLTSSNGQSYTSPWQAIYNHTLLPGAGDDTFSVNVDRGFIESHSRDRLSISIEVAITELQRDWLRKMPLPMSRTFRIPGIGVCNYDVSIQSLADGFNCRVPLRQPALTLLQLYHFAGPCTGAQTIPAGGHLTSAWTGALVPDPADPGLTSVWTDDVILPVEQSWDSGGSSGRPLHFCAETPLSISRYSAKRRFTYKFVQIDLLIKDKPDIFIEVSPQHQQST